MHVGDGPDPPPFIFDNIEVKFVPTFNYLGSTISQTGDLVPEINRRRGIAAGVMSSLDEPLWKRRAVSRQTKLRVYNASVMSILMYGSESWALNHTLAARLNGFDSRSLRKIERIHWTDRVTNVELRERTQQPPASAVAAQRRIRWLGHILRLPLDHPTRAIHDFNPVAAGWRRPRGAPRTRWGDVVRNDLQSCGIDAVDAPALAQDRRRWREITHLVGSTHSDVHEN